MQRNDFDLLLIYKNKMALIEVSIQPIKQIKNRLPKIIDEEGSEEVTDKINTVFKYDQFLRWKSRKERRRELIFMYIENILLSWTISSATVKFMCRVFFTFYKDKCLFLLLGFPNLASTIELFLFSKRVEAFTYRIF